MLYEFCYKCGESIESENLYHCLDCESKGENVNFCENCESSQLHGHPNDHHFLKCAGTLTKFERIHYLQTFFTGFLDQQLIKANVHTKDNQFEDAAKLCEQGLGATTNIIQNYNKLFNLQEQCVPNIIINIKDKKKRSYTSQTNKNDPNYKTPKVYNEQCDANKIAQNNEEVNNIEKYESVDMSIEATENFQVDTEEVKESDKTKARDHLETGLIQFKGYNFGKAIKNFESALKFNKFNVTAEYYLAKSKKLKVDLDKAKELVYTEGCYEAAIKIYDIIMKICPDNEHSYILFEQARCLVYQGNFKEADNILKSISNDKKSSGDYQFEKGIYFYYQGEMEDAKNAFHLAVQLDRENTNFVDMLEKTKIFEEIKVKANNLFREKKYEKSIHKYAQGIIKSNQIDSDNKIFRSVFFFNSALAKSKLKDEKSSIEDCDKALELNPNYTRAWLLKIELSECLGTLKENLNEFKKIVNIALFQDDTNKFESIKKFVNGLEHFADGKLEEAVEKFEKSLKWDTENITVKKFIKKSKQIQYDFSLAQRHIDLDSTDEALRVYSGMSESYSKYFIDDIKIKQAECYLLKHDIHKAEEILEFASDKMRNKSEYWYLKGMLSCFYHGDNVNATKYLNTVISLDKNHEKSLNLIEKIKELEDLNAKSESTTTTLFYNIPKLFSNALSKLVGNTIEIRLFKSVVHFHRAKAYLKIDKPKDCIDDCHKVLEFNPKFVKALLLKVEAQMKLGTLIDCLSDLTLACSIISTGEIEKEFSVSKSKIISDMFYHDALQKSNAGKNQEAIKMLKKSFDSDSKNTKAKIRLDKLTQFENDNKKAGEFFTKKNFKKVLEICDKAIEDCPKWIGNKYKVLKAESSIYEHDPDTARKMLDSIPYEMKNSVDYTYVEGLYCYYLGDIVGAKKYFEKAKDYKNNAQMKKKCKKFDDLYNNVSSLYKRKSYEEAIDKISFAINSTEEDNSFLQSLLHSKLAFIQFKSNKKQNCIKSCIRALELNPKNVKAILLKAKAYKTSGQLNDAKIVYTEALSTCYDEEIEIKLSEIMSIIESDNVCKQALQHLENLDVSAAVKGFEQALKLNPLNVLAEHYLEKLKKIENHLYSAQQSLEESQFKDALECYENIEVVYPECFQDQIKIKQVQCFISLKQIEKARNVLQRISGSVKNRSEYNYFSGLCFYYQGEVEKAKATFEKVQFEGENYNILLHMKERCSNFLNLKKKMNILFENQSYEEVIKECSKFLEQTYDFYDKSDVLHSEFYYKRAIAYSKMGYICVDDVIKDCTKALKLNPEHLDALYLRATAHKELTNTKDCMGDCEQALNLSELERFYRLLVEVSNYSCERPQTTKSSRGYSKDDYMDTEEAQEG